MSAFTSNSIDNLSPRDRWLALSGVGLGVLMATIDSSIVNISLPTLVTVFQTSFAAVQWVVLSYILVITSLILGVARLGDMFNKKMLYISYSIIIPYLNCPNGSYFFTPILLNFSEFHGQFHDEF